VVRKARKTNDRVYLMEALKIRDEWENEVRGESVLGSGRSIIRRMGASH